MSFPIGLKRSAAMVVLRCQDQLLLLRRFKPPHAGKYTPVGGKLEPFEDPYSAALRETYEETGIRVERLQYAGALVETAPIDYNWQCGIYVADIEWMPPPPCDEGKLEWVRYADLPHIPTPPTDWHIYQFVARGRPFALNAIYDAQLRLLSMVEEIKGERLRLSAFD
jgi:8-oxo-dGTP diphosphatase